MEIIEKKYKWAKQLVKRPKTNYIVLHHAAARNCSPDDIHKIHINSNGWAGIGYHFYVRKDGTIYSGRPIDMQGAHVENYNSQCLGICFEGNFEKEKMCYEQIKAGQDLIKHIKSIYPNIIFKKHRDLNATACPGRNFPFEKIIKCEITEAAEIVKELNVRGIMTNSALWSIKCSADTNSYWLARKICNMTKNTSKRAKPLESVNDIVWELHQRGIVTDKVLWLKLFETDKNLYWLGYKAVNMTENI